jgi:hypothetical protein
LYSSHLGAWRKQLNDPDGNGLRGKRRGPKKKENPYLHAAELELELKKTQKQHAKAEVIIALKKQCTKYRGSPSGRSRLKTTDDQMIKAVAERDPILSARDECQAIGLASATCYRAATTAIKQRQEPPADARARRKSPRTLSYEEVTTVLDDLNEPSVTDKLVSQVHGKLLKRGTYLFSMGTMYRLLERENAVRDRRNQLQPPTDSKPELLATAPNHVWSWDTT